VTEIGSPKSPQFADAQTSHKIVASVLREGFEMHLREGRSLFAVEQGFKNMAGIEHPSYTPIYHDASDCQACLCCAEMPFAPDGQSLRHCWKPELNQGAGGN
jgi:hypothetical protein